MTSTQAMAICALTMVGVLSVEADSMSTDESSSGAPSNIFTDNLAPAPAGGAFRMKDYIIWGGSVTRGDNGRYYMFASRWPKSVGMKNWVVNSDVVLASSDQA